MKFICRAVWVLEILSMYCVPAGFLGGCRYRSASYNVNNWDCAMITSQFCDMSIINKAVLLLKSEKTEGLTDTYEESLKGHGFEVMLLKTLTFSYKNIKNLREKLENPDNFSGLIFSSPRCVNAASQALEKTEICRLWGGKSNFCVGETTHKEAKDKLGLECDGKDTGNAVNLAKLIIAGKANYSNPFLFPHGNLKTDTLKVELGKEDLATEGVLVYDTVANPELEEQFSQATTKFTQIPEFVVFFSPSGVHSTINLVRKVSANLDLVKFIAIGPVTKLAMVEQKLAVHKVAKNPTPGDVVNAIIVN